MVIVGRQAGRELPVENGDVGLGRFDASKLHGQELAAMLVGFDREGLDRLGPLLAQMAARELGHLGRTLPAADQGAQNGPAGDSEDVTDHLPCASTRVRR